MVFIEWICPSLITTLSDCSDHSLLPYCELIMSPSHRRGKMACIHK